MSTNTSTARFTGIGYLIIFVAGIFAQFVVRQSLIVAGDAAATADKIMESEALFRMGIASDLIMISVDIALALLFYVLLKPVSQPLALLAAFFRLAQAFVLGMNLLTLFIGLELVSGADYLAAYDAEQLQGLGLVFLEAHGIGYSLALMFFALSLLVLGYLVYRSGYLPKILGVLLIIAAAGYLTDGFAKVLLTNYEDYKATFDMLVFTPAFIGELAFALWLLIKGVNVQNQEERPTLKTRHTDEMVAAVSS